MNFFETAKTIAKLLPAVISAVKAVEAMFPEGGNGAKKLAMVKSMLVAANDHTKQIADFEAFWPVVSKTIGGLISALKMK